MDGEEAERVYQMLRTALVSGYSASALAQVANYQQLERFNTLPYLSATHGNHYLSNYANTAGEVYGNYEDAGNSPRVRCC